MQNKTVKEIFWETLPVKMKIAGVRAIDLAEKLELNKATISNWMNRKAFPEMDNIQRIADVLNCTTDDLLGRNAPENAIDFDKALVASYHAADVAIQSAVCKLLDIKGRS